MARAAPMIRAFNGGVFSPLVEGRPDLERYPSSMRRLLNGIAAPQGPAIGRSGSMFVCPSYDNDNSSTLIPFVFSELQSLLLEFTTGRIRFVTEEGLQVYSGLATTVNATVPFKLDIPLLAANVGDNIVLSGYPASYNLNGEVAKITAKVGTTYTIDTVYPTGKATVPALASLVYSIACDYTDVERSTLNYIHSVDVMYLLTDKQPKKLSRYGAYDWRLTVVKFQDGPYMPINDTATKLTPAGTGNVVATMTANNAPSPLVASATTTRAAAAAGGTFLGRTIPYAVVAGEPYLAFDTDPYTHYAGGVEQAAVLKIDLGAAGTKVVDGYAVFAPKDNRDTSYSAKDFAPSTWAFEGSNNNVDWDILDTQENYILYDSNKSVFFEVKNSTAYRYYRLRVSGLVRNGPIECRIQKLAMRDAAGSTFNITASSIVGINKDVGFLVTDVGRLIRLRGSDGTWRSVEITAFVSSTVVTVALRGEPLPDLKPIMNWRLGYWSDTTGWPICGDFFEDRLFLGGALGVPDMFAGSVTGLYEVFSQTDTFGAVLDDSAIVARLNAKKLSRIYWMETDEKGLLIGTGSSEYILSSARSDAEEITPRNIKARSSTSRGSARVTPVKVDRQVLFIQRSGRTMREYAYSYEADGYKAPSMSQLASHLGVKRIVEVDYAAEPHSIVWCRREDGSIIGLTYNRDENVIGWHEHDFSGAILESIAVLPQEDQLQDALWFQGVREINGQSRKYIERMTRFWDFGMTIDDAHFVDSALTYDGVETTEIYGLQHLEGRQVYGVADTIPFGPKTVTNGMITLDLASQKVIVGLGFDMEAETSRLENGAQDGTAFGKTKRLNEASLGVWDSYGGQVGVWNPNEIDPVTNKPGTVVFTDVEYPDGRGDEIEGAALYTGETLPVTLSPGYEKRGSVSFRRDRSSPLPFNVTYIAPKMNTQDG